jgi:hypothetical protein
LLHCRLFAETYPKIRDAPPHIHSKSPHYRFALFVLAGYSYDEACALLNVNVRTAERWRTTLRATASRYFGRRVTYEFAARYALDPSLRTASEMWVRGSPQ